MGEALSSEQKLTAHTDGTHAISLDPAASYPWPPHLASPPRQPLQPAVTLQTDWPPVAMHQEQELTEGGGDSTPENRGTG